MAAFKSVTFKIKNADIKGSDVPATTTKFDLAVALGEEPTTIAGYQVVRLDDVYSSISVCYKV